MVPIYGYLSVNIGTIFIVNLPINFLAVLFFNNRIMRKQKSFGHPHMLSLITFMNFAIIISVIGALIDSYLICYPLFVAGTGQLSVFYILYLVLIGLGLIFLSFFIFSRILLKYSLNIALKLGYFMVILNLISWFFVIYPIFYFSYFSMDTFVNIAISIIFGLLLILIIYYYKNDFKKVEQRSSPDNHSFSFNSQTLRHSVMLLLAIFLILIYFLTPLMDYHSQYFEVRNKHETNESYTMVTDFYNMEIMIYQLDILWIFCLFLIITIYEVYIRYLKLVQPRILKNLNRSPIQP
jgi:hypothetical protein